MLILKYHNYNFYFHSLGEFYVVFINKVLKEIIFNNKNKYHILIYVFRYSIMLKLYVSIKL